MRFFSRSKGRLHCFPIAFLVFVVALVAGGIFPVQVALAASPYLRPFHQVKEIASTIPANGDLNPYGVAVVPSSIGSLIAGDILVSNFNNSANKQGEGSTIVEISPSRKITLFAKINPNNLHGPCPGGVGLTTALVVLKQGWVIVGSLPTTNGMSATMQAGCLIVLNSTGQVVETFTAGGQINGPWDMTVSDDDSTAMLFVTNVLNGNVANGPVDTPVNKGTILRINLAVPNQGDRIPRIMGQPVTIGSGFSEESDAAALVIGPTGVGLGSDGTLYVADTVNSRIAAIPNAFGPFPSPGTGNTVTVGGDVNGPLGMAIAPNGDILTVNGGDGKIVETTPAGAQVVNFLLDNTGGPPAGVGALFGVAVAPNGNRVYFVDDNTNTLNLFH